jgi:hypothetical protein
LQALLADGIAGISPIADMTLIDDPYVPGPPAPPVAPAPALAPRMAPATGAAVATPAVAPATPSGTSPVPIEALLYRGESALARARALSDVLRGTSAPAPDALAELYDLLDLSASA